MMKELILAIVVIAMLALPARAQDPPLPPQDEQDEAEQNADDAEAAAILKEECGGDDPPAFCMQKHFVNAKPYKLIYDQNCGGGKWVRVHYEECPIAFDDPDFSHHDYMCKGESSSMCGAKTEGMWTWPEWKNCNSVSVCLACPKLGDCDEWAPSSGGGSSTTVIISTNTGVQDAQHSELLNLLSLLEHGQVLTRWQHTRLRTLSASATGLRLASWQSQLIRDELDQHRGQGGLGGGHQTHGGHGGGHLTHGGHGGGHLTHGGHGGHQTHRQQIQELQNLLNLAQSGGTLSESDVRRIQTLVSVTSFTLSTLQNRLVQALVQQLGSSHGTKVGWQGGSGHHQGHGQGLEVGPELDYLLNLAAEGVSLARWQVIKMLDLASNAHLSSRQQNIVQTFRSQFKSSSSASHFSISGSSSSLGSSRLLGSSGSSFGSSGSSFGSSGSSFGSSGSSFGSSSSSSSSSQSSQSSSSSSHSVNAWSNRFGRGRNNEAEEDVE